MNIFQMNLVVAVVLVMLVVGGQPLPYHWSHWRQLQYQRRQQLQPQQQQQQQAQRWESSIIWEARKQQLLREQQQELELQRQEEMEEIISDNNLDGLAMQLGMDTLGFFLQQMREGTPPPMVSDACVTRTTPVVFQNLNLVGDFVYTVCGSGDGAALHIRFQRMGGTTPILDTTPVTTPSPTTPHTPEEKEADTPTTTEATETTPAA